MNGTTGKDTLDEGRGLSASMPFKTIQACINHICDNYNLSRFTATINVAEGDYSSISLGSYQTQTGYIIIRGVAGKTRIVKNANGGNSGISDNSRGVQYWIYDMDIVLTGDVSNLSSRASVLAINCQAEGHLFLRGCNISVVYTGTYTGSSTCLFYAYNVNSGKCTVDEGATININVPKSKCTSVLYQVGRQGALTLRGGSTEAARDITLVDPIRLDYTVRCSGELTVTAATGQSLLRFIGTATGAQRYAATDGGHINTGGQGETFFPGTVAGTVDMESYSWYK